MLCINKDYHKITVLSYATIVTAVKIKNLIFTIFNSLRYEAIKLNLNIHIPLYIEQ